MRTTFIHISAAALVSLSLGACSPVKLAPDTDTEGSGSGSGGSGGGETDGASTGGTGGDGGSEGTVPSACVDLVPRVLGVLETNCAKCHGPGGSGQGGISYILELEQLIANNKVIPGDAASSRIFARMTAPTSPMPPVTEMQRPNDIDKEIIGKWINECAGQQDCGDQSYIPRDEMLKKINQDLSTINLETLPFTRYFSFVHLHNAGWCDS